MENYIENYKKHNKTLFKFMGYSDEQVNYDTFIPHDSITGICILMLIVSKINQMSTDDLKMRAIISVKEDDTEVFIQEWYDTIRPDGYVNVVHVKEFCLVEKTEENKAEYKEENLKMTHRAIYNACVDFVIKKS